MIFHINHKKIVIISATRPASRFSLLEFNKEGLATNFIEEPSLGTYVNLGYMIFKKEIIYLNKGDKVFENKNTY